MRSALPMLLAGLAYAQPAAPGPAMADGETPATAAPEPAADDDSRAKMGPLALDDVDGLDPERALGRGTHLRIFKQAQKRREEIQRLEKQLIRRTQRLNEVKLDVQGRFKALRMLQEELVALADEDEADRGGADAERRRAEEEVVRKKRVRKLAAEFNKMKADEAAKVIEEMDEDLSIDILLLLKDRQAAKILGKLEPKLAAKLSEKIAQLKKNKRARKAR